MTDNAMTRRAKLNGTRPGRHWLTVNTAAWEQLPPNARPYRPGRANGAVDGVKNQSWPLVDPQPTKAFRRPVPKPEEQPEPVRQSWFPRATMTRDDALTMRNACLWAAGLVALLGLVALIVVNVAAVS